MVKDSETKDKLIANVVNLANDSFLQRQLKNNITPLGISDADEVVAREILKYTGTN